MNNKRKNYLPKTIPIAIALLISSSDYAKADQPVHCLRDKAFGLWDFHVSSNVQNLNIFDTQEICTHKVPNKLQIISSDHNFSFAQNEEIWRVKMGDQYQASAQKCSQKGKCEGEVIQGTWSPIYDQAFRVQLDNGLRFISNFRYNINKSFSSDPLKDGYQAFSSMRTGDYESFQSECNKSMVGFVQVAGSGGSLKNHRTQCFFAEQVEHFNLMKSVEEVNSETNIKQAFIVNGKSQIGKQQLSQEDQESPVEENIRKSDAQSMNTPPDEQNVLLEYLTPKKSNRRFNANLEHVPSDDMDLLISTINDMDLGWKADTCKYQKSHSSYGSHCEKSINLAQISNQETLQFGEGTGFQAALQLAQRFQKYPNAQSIPDDELPENHDWRNIGGYNFMNEVRDQSHCGSCYTVSFTQIVENRLKIKYGQKVPMLSAQFMMMCNYMNEGCDGGWPLFHGYLGEQGYLVTEECAPYLGKTKGDQCSNYSHCQPHSKIQSSYFIGKGYGDATEKKIMKELVRNGAVNGEMSFPRVASMYKSGIITSNGMVELHKKVSSLAQNANSQSKVEITDTNLEQRGIEWQSLNHSVTIIGYGVDPKTQKKYWIIRNSYGPNWGDQGDFLIERGTNFGAIEGETTGYDPILCSEGQC